MNHVSTFSFRRILILFSLAAVALMATGQPQHTLQHKILIRDNRSSRTVEISAGTSITATVAGKEYSGVVRDIQADTIVLRNTQFSIRDAEVLYIERPGNPPRPFSPAARRPSYTRGSSRYTIIIPPDTAYDNPWEWQVYSRKMKNETSRQKFLGDDTLANKNFLKFNLAKVAHLEVAFSYERYFTKRFSWETELSAMFGIRSADAYYQIPYPVFNYNGFSVTTNPKFYIGRSNAYLAPVFMYRYLWFTDVRAGWPDDEENGMLQDQYRNDYGISLRLGFMKHAGQFVFDFYLGGGVKYVFLHQLVYSDYYYHDSSQMRWRHPDHSPDKYDRELWQSVFNLGVKIGFGF